MDDETALDRFVASRHRFFERLDRVRMQVESLLEKTRIGELELTDIAILNALHEERASLLEDFQQREEEFIEWLLRMRSERQTSP